MNKHRQLKRIHLLPTLLLQQTLRLKPITIRAQVLV